MKPQRIYKLIHHALQETDYLLTTDIGASSFRAVRDFSAEKSWFQTFANGYSMGIGVGGVPGANIRTGIGLWQRFRICHAIHRPGL
jgi:thiamine pyrophosphate-dependent acetolactate synthase large subunit-like protein